MGPYNTGGVRSLGTRENRDGSQQLDRICEAMDHDTLLPRMRRSFVELDGWMRTAREYKKNKKLTHTHRTMTTKCKLRTKVPSSRALL